MDTFLIVISIILCVIGALVSFMSRFIVRKMNIASSQVIKGIEDEKAIESLKEQKAIMKVKLVGAAIFIPGMIVLYIILKGM
ncbi:MAG: hypothetical protein PHY13_08785 [Clostridia bacterium]|nr:hypothetical protein [Clostridia bacterium]HXK71679.1 hypothetical protein [Clostridia bacterium]